MFLEQEVFSFSIFHFYGLCQHAMFAFQFNVLFSCCLESLWFHAFKGSWEYQKIVGNKAKGRISKRVFQENKACQIFRKTNISYPLIRTRTCGYQGVRNVCFSENLACFVFLKHPFWDSPFCLMTDEIVFSLLSACLVYLERKITRKNMNGEYIHLDEITVGYFNQLSNRTRP